MLLLFRFLMVLMAIFVFYGVFGGIILPRMVRGIAGKNLELDEQETAEGMTISA